MVRLVLPRFLPPQYERRGETRAEKVKMKVPERTIGTSGRIVLVCRGCGELLILLGREDDWSREHRNAFECSGCRKKLTLADRLDRKAYRLSKLLRSSVRPFIPSGGAGLG